MRLSLLAAWLASVAFAGQPPKTDPAPKTPAIVFPTFPAGEDKAPTPRPLDPAAVPKLAADTLYVVQSDAPFLQFASPPDLVKVTKAQGPVTMFAKFVDGDGKAELRTFSAKHVAIIQATGSGRVELLSVPVGAADEKDAVRKTVDVGSGQAPQPPPDPIPEPKPKPPPVDPKPEPKPVPVSGPVWLILVEESSLRTEATAAIVNNTLWLTKIKSAGHSFRVYDKDDEAAIKAGYVKVATEDRKNAAGEVIRKAPGVPCLIVVDNDGEVIRAARVKSTSEIDAILKEVAK